MRQTRDTVTLDDGRWAGRAAWRLLVYCPRHGPRAVRSSRGRRFPWPPCCSPLATILFGLAVVLPLWLRERSQHLELGDRAAELEMAVVTDPLTGLYNRRYFEDALREYLAEFLKIGAPLAVLTLDLDHFKSVNDTYGHDAGDVVLKELAKALRGVTREHDIVARTGGEEFCIVAPFARPDQIRPFAERVCRLVAEMRVDVGVVIIRPTISIGVASTADGVSTVKELVKVSDERLYQAKEQGRNRVAA